MATSRNLQDASGPARVIVTTDVLNCQSAIDNEKRIAAGLKPMR
jgi:hypothetical protein